MKHFRPLNKKAHTMARREEPDVHAHSCSECCNSFAPGWEVSSDGSRVDPCAGGWQPDLPLCMRCCCWGVQVPDDTLWSRWLDACGNIQNDWQRLCVVPD